MTFPTTNATQELPAINQILTSCGQAPVTTLDQTNPEVAIAYDTLLQVSREIQAEGWTFNKEYHVEFPTDVNKEIPIANNIIQIRNYITARAASIVSSRIVGDDDQYARLQQQESFARSTALEYETRQGQYTMFGHPQGSQNYYQSYQPFHALQR